MTLRVKRLVVKMKTIGSSVVTTLMCVLFSIRGMIKKCINVANSIHPWSGCILGLDAQQNQWMCSALDGHEVNSRYYLPDLPVIDSTAVANITERLFSFNTHSSIYLTPSELGCQGVVSAVQFCYSDISHIINLGTERRIFTLLILEELSGPQFRVSETIDVLSTPTDQICTQGIVFDFLHYCCDTFEFNHPTANFAFATTNERGLLRFHDQTIQVDYIISNTLQLPSQGAYAPNEDARRSSQQLKLFQFFISKLAKHLCNSISMSSISK